MSDQNYGGGPDPGGAGGAEGGGTPGAPPPPGSPPGWQQPPPAGQPGWQGQQGYPPQPQGGQTNGLAIAALICGILAIVTFWSVWLGILLGIAAIVLGVLGRKKAKEINSGGGMAMGGLVTGIIGLLLALLVVVFIGAMFAGGGRIADELEREMERLEEEGLLETP